MDKLANVYLTVIGNEGDKNSIDIKVLWRWVKELIQFKKSQEANNSSLYNKRNNNNINSSNMNKLNTEVIILFI